ncbi:MAG: alpha-N-acetylglucosaminidase [Brachybacterium sp.]|uniref:alpha-N-acetylglucosaminidase TIM-barrel domain-containing protein n=1 Tax=Brachybacterium sp. TaxID=1891286 RepID=UPI002647AA80|nr:alpha-N-acetylglucosaminidase TIM-barrel domain-containing protein [Brachybacterium sp.]MDN5688040.1 alpha-N-acetylglucosaminidase [Brachybacterium sp.]
MNPERPDSLDGVRALVGRRAPDLLARLHLRLVPPETSGTEHVTIRATGDELWIEASSPSAACVGLARILEDVLGADLSWDGPPVLDASAPLPELAPQRLETALGTRYHLNPVAFGYTMAFWDWEQWERHIDWMALHGVTAPLNLVGHDAVLVRMLIDLGMERDAAARFVGGPAFLPWTTMGITHDVGAVLTDEVLAARARLGRRIADRERELGMTVVLPGFGGQLPAALVGTEQSIEWQGWQNSLADPADPLFAAAAAALHGHQKQLLGTDHLYAVDPYIESLPPTTSPDQLAGHAAAIFEGMATADPDAVWILQGWPFHYRASYWTEERVRSLLSRVPEDRLILLDLWGEHAPMWHSTGAMYGRRWLWCLAHTFGGRFGLFGDLDALADDLAELRPAAADGSRGRLEGFGITSEALDDNAVVYELALRALWSPMPSLPRWQDEFIARRWGTRSPVAREAWELIARTLYGAGRTRATPSPLIARPWSHDLPFAGQRLAGEALLEKDGPPSANVDAENDQDMLGALPALSRAARGLLDLTRRPDHPEALAHDVAQLSIHVAAQAARAPLRAMVAATAAGDSARIHREAATLEALIHSVDAVAATRPELLVGRWITDARRWAGADDALADALERDARSLISVWGEQSSGLHDYSARHWSGPLTDLHLARWLAWAGWLADVADGSAAGEDPEPLRAEIRRIEETWRDSTDPYPVDPQGDLAEQVEQLLDLAEKELPRLVPDAAARPS